MLRVGGIMGKRTGYRLTRLSESIQRHEAAIAAERRAVIAATRRRSPVCSRCWAIRSMFGLSMRLPIQTFVVKF